MSDDIQPNQETSRFQKFTMERVHRSQLRGADYNPRQISDEAKTRLRDTLKRVGLVQPIVWNKTTGNIVGGHQRLRQLDVLEATDSYFLEVARIEVDEVRERELNVLLNNPEVCGDWDLEKLGDLLHTEGLELENTGFDMAEFMRMFGEAPSQAGNAHQAELADQLKDVKGAYEKLAQSSASKDDTDFYMVVVFASYEHRKELVEELGIQDNRYIDGRVLLSLIRDLRLKQSQPALHGDKGNLTGTGEGPADGTEEPD